MRFIVYFDRPSGGLRLGPDELSVDLPIPVCQGEKSLILASDPEFRLDSIRSGFYSMSTPDWMVGAIRIPTTESLKRASEEAYSSILQSIGSFHLLRIWNYVPHINKIQNNIENYRAFCSGRADAFERYPHPLPSASAVGVAEDSLSIVFLAAGAKVQHHENLEQMPACQYPDIYGPRAPFFARASCVSIGSLTRGFISGTASIKGHQSLHAEDMVGQIHTTLHNLNIMQEMIQINHCRESIQPPWESTVYLRNPHDLPVLLQTLTQHGEDPHLIRVIEADICRRELLVEIEQSFALPQKPSA